MKNSMLLLHMNREGGMVRMFARNAVKDFKIWRKAYDAGIVTLTALTSIGSSV